MVDCNVEIGTAAYRVAYRIAYRGHTVGPTSPYYPYLRYYAVQGHSRSSMSSSIEEVVSDFLSLINSNYILLIGLEEFRI